ncbi:iron(II) transport protein B [Thermococcus kodakarensis KOD1]|uniref:Ferrous iron transport protein B n=1 Tax=Thermococcus kodakarensis (strain ATCC BAA-918 / JCM 12380 / KOD1) TaxID=69014 RepID=Q5JG50_THEKO|nr:ferrous iron transport protein B [Thermococcus kodakarensis]WCN28742.1 ferrous iron transport protein B [Thermococcus kodakarensis]WCN31039.1 ferrous iron transport protein B [Thermococcus kodakarensis]BAD84903.1 iron(II) transport protein B [Thermococcus kodakarensis KOD1]
MSEVVIALIGNPNAGKTTLFNALTGLRQHVGNWPGVTVEKKEGEFEYKEMKFRVVDLPGVYGLTAYSIDEKIARDFIVKEKPRVVVDIVDASNLERNLYLTLQLLEIGANVVVALNKMDLAEEKGYKIDPKKLEEALGVPVVPMVASEGKGIEELKAKIVEAIKGKPRPIEYPNFEAYIERIMRVIERDDELVRNYNPRWLAIKLLEGDDEARGIVEKSRLRDDILRELINVSGELHKKYGDVELALADERYGLIEEIAKRAIVKKEDRITFSDMLDEVLTHKYLGVPIFISLMWAVFKFTFDVSAPFSDIIDWFFSWLGDEVGAHVANDALASLLRDGIIGGLGSVLVFLPPIAFLFLAFSWLEDSGYMARAAFVMDRVMHHFGLHGKSVIPMIMGFGCNVPAIMATRTLEDEKDRILTILVNPLMSCPARLPIYAVFAGAFFAGREGTVITSMYLLGIAFALIIAWLFRKLIFKGEPSYFVMELPPYNRPNWGTIFGTAWTRTEKFLRKAGTVIFAGVIVVWLLSVTGPSGYLGSEALENGELLAKSWVASLGHALQPLFAPMGWDWKAAVALFFGFIAKEIVVGTLGVLYGVGDNEQAISQAMAASGAFNPATAYAFMAFSLIYVPCLATIAVIKQEAGWKWALFAVAYELILAYIVALLIVAVGGVFL